MSELVMSKNMTTCEFVRELYNAGIRDPQRIEDHACAAGYGTYNVTNPIFHGKFFKVSSLYRINEKFWCDGGGCGILCDKLRDFDVQDDIQCAEKIMKKQGTDAFHHQCDTNISNEEDWFLTKIRECVADIMETQDIPDFQPNCGISWSFFWPLLIVGILINL